MDRGVLNVPKSLKSQKVGYGHLKVTFELSLTLKKAHLVNAYLLELLPHLKVGCYHSTELLGQFCFQT